MSWAHWRIAAMNELQYRANFFVQLIHSVLALVTVLWRSGWCSRTPADLGGWSQPELLIVMGIHIVGRRRPANLHRTEHAALMQDVEEGTYDYVLTKPVDPQLLTSVRDIRVWNAVDVMLGLMVMAVGLAELAA